MTRTPSWAPIRPSTSIARPGSIPAIRRRPSQTTVIDAGAVVELRLEGRYAAARAQRDGPQRAAQLRPARGRERRRSRRCRTCRTARTPGAGGGRPGSPGLAQRLIVRRSFLLVIGLIGSGRQPGWSTRRACGGIDDGQRLAHGHRVGAAAHGDLADASPPSPSASSGRAAAAPSSVQRSIQRGPLMPITRDDLGAGCRRALTGPRRSARCPTVPRARSPCRRAWATSAAICGRTSDQRSPLRGAAKARSSSAPSGPAMTTDCTAPLASSTWRRSSRSGSGVMQQRAEVDPLDLAVRRQLLGVERAVRQRVLGVGRLLDESSSRSSTRRRSTASDCALRRNFTCARSLLVARPGLRSRSLR